MEKEEQVVRQRSEQKVQLQNRAKEAGHRTDVQRAFVVDSIMCSVDKKDIIIQRG